VITLSYHVSHEQFSPRDLLDFVQRAESAGFDAAFSSDHIHPWLPQQGHSGFIWSWLGAALQATQRLRFAGITIPGGWRYHPAITAQALATLAQMFPGRLPWVALGSGEALNECVVGRGWPEKPERNARLLEAAEIIRELLAGKRVSRDGDIPVDKAQIWSRPDGSIQLMCAAMSPETARWAGEWADGLVTVAGSMDKLERIVKAFRSSAPEKPMHAKVDISWAPTESEALANAHQQWRANALDSRTLADARTPEDLERAAAAVEPEHLRKAVFISSDLSRHVEWLRERAALGFVSLDLHNVGPNQREFIDAFGQHVLPALKQGT
jgi:coenzyme F420-dependent glucose-6-phosphate dehydrogenase